MKILTAEKAEKFLKGIPVAKSVLAKDVKQAEKAAALYGYPVVLKIVSPKAIHKTEINGIRFPASVDELRREYAALEKTAKAKKLPLTGILVQELIRGEEAIIGLKNDPTFGHVLLFGIGGKYTELMKDVSFRACPVDLKIAQEMIDELRMKKVFYGFRGAKPVNMLLLKKIMVSVSLLPRRHKNIEEMDINPFILNDKTGKAVDVRIGLS